MHVVPWECERRDARIFDREHTATLALGPRSRLHGMAGKIAAGNLRASEGQYRNGGRSLAKVHELMATDSVVGWAWHPGEGRSPAPGMQARLAR